VDSERANGQRYPLVGGTRQRRFDGINFKPRKLPENAATPTSRVHAVLGNLTERQTRFLQKDNIAILTKFYNELQLWQPTKRTRLTRIFAKQKPFVIEKRTMPIKWILHINLNQTCQNFRPTEIR